MSLDADLIVDRRRMRRKLTFWRVFSVLVLIAAVVAVAATMRRGNALTAGGDYIARVKITGLIRNDQDRVDSLERLAKSSAKAVIVRIDSPGGTTAGSEALHNALRRVAAEKPLVVVVDGLAASGGYIAAIGADRIVAQTSLVGSIGVLFQYPNVSELLKTIGVKVEEIKSSPAQGRAERLRADQPEARAAVEALVMDSYTWFRSMVRDRRQLDDATLQRVADGRVFTGRQGLELRLIDEIGNEKTAVDWLAKEKGLKANTPVRDWQLKSRLGDLTMLHLGVRFALEAFGLSAVAERIEALGSLQAVERLILTVCWPFGTLRYPIERARARWGKGNAP